MEETTIAILGVAFIGIFGYILEKFLERRSLMFKDKRIVYPKYLSLDYKQIFELNKEDTEQLEQRFRMAFYASDDTIKKYAEFRRLAHEMQGINENSDEFKSKRVHAKKLFNETLLLMRKDCYPWSRTILKDIESLDFIT